MESVLVLGGPGAGKTERALEEVDRALQAGVSSMQIAFSTFTKAGVKVAIDRACEKFHLDPRELPHFRTLHSLSFRELGLNRAEVLGPSHLAELSELTGEELSDRSDPTAPTLSAPGDELLFLEQLARSTGVTLQEVWRSGTEEVDTYRLERFRTAYDSFRKEHALVDFADMLDRYANEGSPLNVRVAVIDEAQDLTEVQWRVARVAFSGVEKLLVCGDDKQAVHRWAGADVEQFLALDYPREVLPQSHRVPRQVFPLAEAVGQRITKAFPNPWQPSDREGELTWLRDPTDCPLDQGEWLVLGRARSQLVELAEICRSEGVYYSLRGQSSVNAKHVEAILGYEALRRGEVVAGSLAEAILELLSRRTKLAEGREYTAADLGLIPEAAWHDALVGITVEDREYYLACRRRGEKLLRPPRVRIETLHGAKGDEAENVLLLTDLTKRTARGLEEDPDSEHRVFYVGLTRARERLYVVEPRGRWGYEL